jgi:pimeloyl-ACP methyl ester carboxylesterase
LISRHLSPEATGGLPARDRILKPLVVAKRSDDRNLRYYALEVKNAMAEPIYPTYYDSRRHFHKYFDAHARQMGLKARTPATLKAWMRRARAKLVEILGLRKMAPAPPRARQTDSVDCGDHVRQRWLMHSQRDLIVPFYVLSPRGGERRLPAVICPHGHGSGGKAAPAGVRAAVEVSRSIVEHNYDYGVQFARAGFRVFCPDARGFGERQEKEARGGATSQSCHYLQLMGAPLGIPVAGMWVFDLLRLVDHILARRDVLPDRLGCAGLSGGGYQTLFLAAVDPRITCAGVSGYFYGVRDSLLEMPGNCDCNVVPRLWESFDMGDIGALIAPRPLLIETGDQDPLNGSRGVKNVTEQLAITRKAYKLLKATDRLAHDVFAGQHRWNGVEAVPWMQRWMQQA